MKIVDFAFMIPENSAVLFLPVIPDRRWTSLARTHSTRNLPRSYLPHQCLSAHVESKLSCSTRAFWPDWGISTATRHCLPPEFIPWKTAALLNHTRLKRCCCTYALFCVRGLETAELPWGRVRLIICREEKEEKTGKL